MKPFIVLFLLVFVSCQDDPHFLGEFENINTRDAVKGMFANMATDIKEHGLKAKSNYMVADFYEYWILPSCKQVIEKDSVKKIYQEWDKQNKLIDYKIDNIQTYPITLLRVAYHFNSEITFKDSLSVMHTLKQIESGVAYKFNSESKWMFLNGHISNINSN